MPQIKILLTPTQQKKIDNAINQHRKIKQINDLVKHYKGKSATILRIKEITTKQLNKCK